MDIPTRRPACGETTWCGIARRSSRKRHIPTDPRAAEAISHYKLIEKFDATSLIEVRLKTGKRNQIRIQARLRGHTLVGELRYTYGPDELRPIPFKRQALHAWRLGFDHPAEQKRMRFEAPMPDDMKKLIATLRRGTSIAQNLGVG